MNPLRALLEKLVPKNWAETDWSERSVFRYRRLWKTAVFLHALFCILPLLIMTGVNYSQYKQTMRHEMIQPIYHLTSNTRRALGFFLEERRAALNFLIHEFPFERLSSQEELAAILRNLKTAFGGFVDVSVINSSGEQVSYVGPYALRGKNYADQDWFHEVNLRGAYISDMFRGFRNFPHFVIAVKHEGEGQGFFVLRATIDMDMLHRQIRSLSLKPASDAFLIDQKGILQTPSNLYGDVMEKCSLPVPPLSQGTEIVEETDEEGKKYIIAYSYIPESPFVFMVVTDPAVLSKSWFALRRSLLIFLTISVIVILALIIATSTVLVAGIRAADQRRTALFHEMEYTNKMATIGRLSAGIAHEINNPLAIINEKAGLLRDLAKFSDDFPKKERFLELSNAIIGSVERCSTITHRLLGFAKHMNVDMETVNLETLTREVLIFLEKEASYRNLTVNVNAAGDVPFIQSDRGQLQQVFLNIINNAFAAVDDGGRIDIDIARVGQSKVSVKISDNGCGISKESLKHIFEPFFTTKGNYGTGLGLSITYGIVSKLGGDIKVESELGRGTSFTVILPIRSTISEQ